MEERRSRKTSLPAAKYREAIEAESALATAQVATPNEAFGYGELPRTACRWLALVIDLSVHPGSTSYLSYHSYAPGLW